MRTVIFVFILAFCFLSSAQMPKGDEQIGTQIPDFQWTDVLGRTQRFHSLKGAPVVLVPFYTGCHATCPVTVKNLIQATAQTSLDIGKFQVLLFSMDPRENASSLKLFRDRNHLPLNWMLGYADSEQSQRLWDTLGFRFITLGQDYVHPDWIVFLTPDLKISSLLPGNRIASKEVDSLVSNAQKDRTFSGKAGPWLLSFSILGLLFSTIGVTHLFSAKKEPPQTQT